MRDLKPEDLFALRFVHDARLAPHGKTVAYVASRTVESVGTEFFELFLVDLPGIRLQQVEFSGSITTPRWSPDGKKLCFLGKDGRSCRLYLYELCGRSCTPITPLGLEVYGAPFWSPDGNSIVFSVSRHHSNSNEPTRIRKRVFKAEGWGIVQDLEQRLCLVSLPSRSLQALHVGCNVAVAAQFSPNGNQILFLGAEAAVGDQALVGGLKLFTLNLENGARQEILGEQWYIATAVWSPCGKRIVFVGARDSPLIVPKADLWVVNSDGSGIDCRTAGLSANVGFRIHHDMPTWDTSQDNMLCVPRPEEAYVSLLRGGRTEICRISLHGEARCETVVGGERSCLVMDANARSHQLAYCTTDLTHPWDLYLLDLTSKHETQLTSLNADVLQGWPALRTQHLEFKSSDGLPLEGWCLTRSDLAGPQPTILFIHGGPMLAVGHAFRFDFHLLATNGWTVVFSNFRGSSGYGDPFMRGLAGDWGARGYPDHIATINAAISKGLADPARLGVWGPSHGGFATCWLVTHTRRFRAAVAESAVTNFTTLYYLSDAPDLWIKDLGGRPDEIPDVYRSRSPLTYAHNCRTPTLLLHGEDDLRCPIAEAEQFYRALHDAGCVTELVGISGMEHMGDSTGPLVVRKAQNEALLDWFERYL